MMTTQVLSVKGFGLNNIIHSDDKQTLREMLHSNLLPSPNEKAWNEYKMKMSLFIQMSQMKQKIRNSMKTKLGSEDYQIKHVHLAYTLQPNELVVQWHTNAYEQNTLGVPMVRIGKNRDDMNTLFHIGGVTTAYGNTNVTGFDHSVLLTALDFDTTYQYQVGFGFPDKSSFTIQSQIYNFTTRSQDPAEVTIILFGDMGVVRSGENIEKIGKRVAQNAGNGNFFIYHLGDISYADFYPGK